MDVGVVRLFVQKSSGRVCPMPQVYVSLTEQIRPIFFFYWSMNVGVVCLSIQRSSGRVCPMPQVCVR